MDAYTEFAKVYDLFMETEWMTDWYWSWAVEQVR